MKGMRFDPLVVFGFLMALSAGGIGIGLRGQLILGRRLVHGMTGETGHFSSSVTTGGRHGRELSATCQNRSVFPPALGKKLRVGLEISPPLFIIRIFGVLNVVTLVMEVFSWAKLYALMSHIHGRIVVGHEDAVTLTANVT